MGSNTSQALGSSWHTSLYSVFLLLLDFGVSLFSFFSLHVRKTSHSYPDVTLKKDSLLCELFLLAFLTYSNSQVLKSPAWLACRRIETSLQEIFLKTDTWKLSDTAVLHVGAWGRTEPCPCPPYRTPQDSPAYLFDESCCLQAAFAISHLILELLPQLLEIVSLPQNVILVCGVLLAQLPAPPHHICTYGPVGLAFRFKSLAEGWEICQHNSPLTSWGWRESPDLHYCNTYAFESPVSYPCLWPCPEMIAPWLPTHRSSSYVLPLIWSLLFNLLWRRYLFVIHQLTCLVPSRNNKYTNRCTEMYIKIIEEALVWVFSCRFSSPSLVHSDSLL